MTEEIIIENAFHLCQRLEQENKALKQEIDDLLNKNPDCNDEFGCQELIELKKENKELKEEIKRYSAINEQETKDYAELNKDLLTERQGNAELATENHNLRKALEEIREDMEQDTTCESKECGCDDYAECLNCIKETILNKINEVLNESN